jgi:glycosyltransferase involved in cell wall biosynthesis
MRPVANDRPDAGPGALDPSPNAPIRVAYTLEQCWHPSPGGTAIAALRIAYELAQMPDDVELLQVAGRHPQLPAPEFRPSGSVAMLPLARPMLYEAWTRLNWPRVEAVTGDVDIAHATGLIPCATAVPMVVTVHDLAFLHDPGKFSRHGVRIMRRSITAIRRRAARVICSSRATYDDCVSAGIARERLRIVPLGVDVRPATGGEVRRVRRHYRLPDEFVLFVGTLEPRKNLARLADAAASTGRHLVVAGAAGWGDQVAVRRDDVQFIGFVPDLDLGPLYAAASVFAYPSEREGFGLPVAEAMAQGTAVVTSASTSTEEVAGGAAVLVDPFDVADIARGLDEASDRRDELGALGVVRAGELSWTRSAALTLAVYREIAP